jgi:hypothetical protein
VVVLEAAKPVFASALGLMRSTVRVLAEGAHTHIPRSTTQLRSFAAPTSLLVGWAGTARCKSDHEGVRAPR